MASPSSAAWVLLICMSASSELARFASAESRDPCCPIEPVPFLYSLESRCSTSISPGLPPLQVDGDLLDSILSSKDKNECTALLFYASWCPFSQRLLPIFDVLSSMFPQVEHLVVEQSSAMSSVLSRYGIHSLPSILVGNQTSMVKYHGSKTLLSLVRFYERNSGSEPVLDFMEDQFTVLSSGKESSSTCWNTDGRTSIKEMMMRDPYLSLSVLFLSLRVLVFRFSETLCYLKALLWACLPHLNLDVFGETSQILMGVLHMIDVRRPWRKLRLCKSSNFRVSARNAQVWASSLASVSAR